MVTTYLHTLSKHYSIYTPVSTHQNIYISTHRAHMQHSFVVSHARICTINFLPPSLGHNPTTQTQTPYHIRWPSLLCSVSSVELGDLISPHSQESGHWCRGHRVSLDIARRRSGQVDIPDTSWSDLPRIFPASQLPSFLSTKYNIRAKRSLQVTSMKLLFGARHQTASFHSESESLN